MKGKKCSTAIYTMLFAILGILWLALPGCSETVPELLANPPQIPQSFTCEIQFSMEGLEGSAHLERPGRSGELQPPSAAPLNPDSGLEICFSAPETLAGVSILCLEDISQVQIGSVTADFLTSSDGQNNALPNGSLVSVLSKAISLASLPSQPRENWSQEKDSSNWIFTGNLAGNMETPSSHAGSFRLTVSNDGLPVALAVDDAGISVQFSQVCPVL